MAKFGGLATIWGRLNLGEGLAPPVQARNLHCTRPLIGHARQRHEVELGVRELQFSSIQFSSSAVNMASCTVVDKGARGPSPPGKKDFFLLK